MIVLGIDWSLNATGVARLNLETGHSVIRTIKAGTRRGHARHEHLRMALVDVMKGVDYAAVEGLSFGSHTGVKDEIYGGHMILRHELFRRHITYALVPPANLKGYVTGDGGAGKIDVMREIQRSFPKLSIADDNQADAMGLACMVARYRGQLVDAHRKRWPHTLEGCHWADQDGEPRIIKKARKKPTFR